MKAMLLNAPERLAFDDVARPTPGPGEILIRVTNSGICGTDLKIYRGAIPVAYPRIMGHEMIGEVADAGGQSGFRTGDRVIVDPQLFCGSCFHCRIGQTHLCMNGQLIGRDTNGGFAEYVVAPATHVFRLPDSIDRRTAPLIQVLTTCVHAQRLTKLFLGESVVVLGLGVTGQLHTQLARARGANPVIGVTRSAARRELAEKLGAHMTIRCGGEGGALEKVLEATDGRERRLWIYRDDGCGSAGGGGDPHGAVRRATVAFRNHYREGRRSAFLRSVLQGTGHHEFPHVARSEDYPSAIDLVQQGSVRLEPLVSHVMPLSELNAAMALLGSDDGQRMKIILENS